MLTDGRQPDEHAIEKQQSLVSAVAEVFRIALPLMVSTGTFALVLFADRTLLLWHDGSSMSASMAGGNLFWVIVCLPVGIASMTGAFVSQYIGAGEESKIGRFLWQSVWMSLLASPLFLAVAVYAENLFRATGQPEELVPLEAVYLRLLMIGAVGIVLETALSGFFSGTQRTQVIMWVSLASGLINFVLDLVLIFGWGPIPSLGIAGAAIASVISFWFKSVCYGWLLLRPEHEQRYQIRGGFAFDASLLRNLLFFGLPTGLMFVTEAGGFAGIVLRIGRLGDLPLRATTMAINFNMIAFIPLVGVSIAASVLVGRHLIESGPRPATRSALAALAIGWLYSGAWVVVYLMAPHWLMSLYEMGELAGESKDAIELARGLLPFIALYVVLDATQLILAGALRGAGDTWFVLGSGFMASVTALTIGICFEPTSGALNWWWWMVTLWIWLIALAMAARFWQGGWQQMRMV